MGWTFRMAALGLLGAGLFIMPAQADWNRDIATLQCAPERNEALVRVGSETLVWGQDGPVRKGEPRWLPLPDSLAAAWAAGAEPDEGDCQLADGRHVVMKIKVGQAYPYGMAGGAPVVRLSLWIDNRVVLRRYTIVAGNADLTAPDVSAIQIGADFIMICDRPSHVIPGSPGEKEYAGLERDAEGCFTQPLDLPSRPLDALQMAMAETADIGKITVAATYNETFCRQFILPSDELAGRGWPRAREAVAYGPPVGEDVWGRARDDEGRAFVVAPGGLLRLKWDYFDFDNDGVTDTVILGSADSHYMDGDMIFYKSGEHPKAATALSDAKDLDGYATWAKENGFTQITGLMTPYQSDRYTHFAPFQLDGTVFFFAYPTSAHKRPSAVLYRQSVPGNLDTVCLFQEVLHND